MANGMYNLDSRPNEIISVRQCYKRKWHKNKLSGHSWAVDVPINKWEVHSSRYGVLQTCRSQEKAEKIVDWWNS